MRASTTAVELDPDDAFCLAVAAHIQGFLRKNLDAAADMFERALDIKEKHLSADDPSLETGRHNLGSVCARLGDTARAVQLGRQVLASREKRLGTSLEAAQSSARESRIPGLRMTLEPLRQQLRALGVLGRKRFELLPDVPAVAETLSGYEASTWAGIGVPRGTAPDIIQRLNREANEGLAQPDIKARLADVGTVPMVLSPDEFRAYIAAEFLKWDKVVKVAGIKPD